MENTVEIKLNGQTVSAYLAKSAATKSAVILIHEVWGMEQHVKDVADRLSHEGFTVLAPDLLKDTELEKLVTPEFTAGMKDPDKRASRQVELRKVMAPLSSPEFSESTLAKVQACFSYLKSQPNIKKVGVMGFCFGGTYSFSLAIDQPELAAAVPFYGHCDAAVSELSKIKCPIFAFYGENDHNLMEKLPDLDSKMKQAGVNFKYKVYTGTGHAFFNDTNTATYNEEAAKDSWPVAVNFLMQNLAA